MPPVPQAGAVPARRAPIFDFIDDESRNGAERQVKLAQRRLAHRLSRPAPSIGELAAAMPDLVDAEDARRAAEPEASGPAPLERAQLSDLYGALQLANLAYYPAQLETQLGGLGYRVLSRRDQAGKCRPAYYVAFRGGIVSTLALVIRGTMEPADVLTDIDVAPMPFLGTRGHGGVVRSAQLLHEEVAPSFARYARERCPDRLRVVGHSLGAATASALALLWRRGGAAGVARAEADALATVECLAFCPVPFVADECLARQAEGITAVVNGMDMFPRLSLSSIDRLFLRLAAKEGADHSSASLVRRGVVTAVANAIGSLLGTSSTDAALAGKEAAAKAPEGELGQNEAGAANGVVAREIETKEGVEETGTDEGVEDAEEMFVVGKIHFLERLFAEHKRCAAHDGLCPQNFRERQTADLTNIEASSYMIDDHFAPGLLGRLKSVLDASEKPCNPVVRQRVV